MHGWTWQLLIACWILWGALWFVMALFAKRTAVQADVRWPIAAGVVSAAMFLVLRTRTHPTAGEVRWEHTTAVEVVTSVLLVGGLLVTAWARLVLGGNWSGGIDLKKDHELISSGPYAVVRHPIYTGLISMVFGSAVYYGQALVIGVALAVAVVFYLKSQREEQLMTETFPDAYPAYRARTKAIIPFVL